MRSHRALKLGIWYCVPNFMAENLLKGAADGGQVEDALFLAVHSEQGINLVIIERRDLARRPLLEGLQARHHGLGVRRRPGLAARPVSQRRAALSLALPLLGVDGRHADLPGLAGQVQPQVGRARVLP